MTDSLTITESPAADGAIGSLSDVVLQWGLPRLRDLPWRQTRDPWAILVSEVMLQQTQALRVVPKWQQFMAAFPTPVDCAAAALGDVLRVWQGLGYPRRARNLHAAAAAIVAAGEVPQTFEGLLALPGVGQYTARAVLAFAFEVDAAVVETNIARVLARVSGHRLTAKQAQASADAALPPGEAWAWNQSLMDLGAALCRPTAPSCRCCPLAAACAWRGEGEDPSVGSAAVSKRQDTFAGSDRQARGKLLGALSHRPLRQDRCATVMGVDERRASKLVAALAEEGLVVRQGQWVALP